jgi:hypothetical protein
VPVAAVLLRRRLSNRLEGHRRDQRRLPVTREPAHSGRALGMAGASAREVAALPIAAPPATPEERQRQPPPMLQSPESRMKPMQKMQRRRFLYSTSRWRRMSILLALGSCDGH